MDNKKINDMTDKTLIEELGEIDFYSALQAAQNELTTNYPDLFSDGDLSENITEAQKQKLQNYISKHVVSNKVRVKGMDTKTLCHRLYQEMAEYSILTDYIHDVNNEIEEINVNAWNDVEVRRTDGAAEKIEHFCNPMHARNVMRRLVTASKTLIDDAMPMAEGNLKSNTRIVVLQSPIVDKEVGVVCSIRLLKPNLMNRQFFIDNGTVSEEEMTFLELAIRSGVSMCFVGATGSGKTTLMNYLLSTIPNKQRIITIENNARELSLIKADKKGNVINNVVHTITRPHEDEKFYIDQEDLVVKALRLDPKIICVGEMRDTESYAAQEASLTGHTVVTSLHADGVEATHMRIAMLCMKKYPIDIHVGLLQAAMAFPLIIYLSKLENNTRRVMEITECVVEETERIYCPLFEYEITRNTRENGKVVIDGRHKRVGNISSKLRKTMILNGATTEEIESIKFIKD